MGRTTMPAEPIAAMAEAADVMSEAADLPPEAADDYDDALLDMIALEMATPDPADADDLPKNETFEIEAAELPAAEPIIVA